MFNITIIMCLITSIFCQELELPKEGHYEGVRGIESGQAFNSLRPKPQYLIGPVYYDTFKGYYKNDPIKNLEINKNAFCPKNYKAVSPYAIKGTYRNSIGNESPCWHHYAWCEHV